MRLMSYYGFATASRMVYMLQQVEYDPSKFLHWFMSLPDLGTLQKRGALVRTKRAQAMLVVAYVSQIVLITYVIMRLVQNNGAVYWLLGLLLVPFVTAFVIFVVTFVLQSLVIDPKQHREIANAQHKLSGMQAIKLAVIGSYGKTTMKEILATVLAEGKKVAATPGNKNVLISHARWVNGSLVGDEEVLIFEYGEGEPGDIAKLASLSQPTVAVITGLAPAHLDYYPSLEAIADDFAEIQKRVEPNSIFMNSGSELLTQKIKAVGYSEEGVAGWSVSDVVVDFGGTQFTLSNGSRQLRLHTGLLGRHQIGPVCAVVELAVRLGLNDEQIIAGVAKTKPFEHRMQARQLQGAWIIDDTYNGNIEGMRAGLELLKELPGQKKIYVTPGLVDQGAENEAVHKKLGALIAAAQPDKLVLIQNSVTAFIQAGLAESNYQGEVVVETNPLEYYTNLEHYLAAGDVVMLQNDWPDSYQ